MEKHQNKIFWAIVLSETTHVFCCVLPTIFSVLSLFAGLGLIGVIPSYMVNMHDVLHRWEVPMLIVSGLVLALGWILYLYSRKVDCHDSGCHHGPCEPKKSHVSMVLLIASLLFVVNLAVYTVFHRGMNVFPESETVEAVHDHAH